MEKELREEILREVDALTAYGFDDQQGILFTIEFMFGDEDVDGDWLRRVIRIAWKARLNKEAGWPAVTDYDRLALAFEELNQRGILVLHKAGVTMQEGEEEVAEQRQRWKGDGLTARGYGFYHAQDVGRALEGGGLYLAFGDFDNDDAGAREIGEEIVAALERQDLAVDWDHSVSTRILIPAFQWRKRLPVIPYPLSVFQGSKHYDLWVAFSEGKKTEAIASIQGEERRSFLGLWKKKAVTDVVLQKVLEALTAKEGGPLSTPALPLKEVEDGFADWVRFLIALQSSGGYSDELRALSDPTLEWLGKLASEVSQGAGNYPGSSIAGWVWGNGAFVREWCEPLAYFFEVWEKPKSKAIVLQYKCKITASIMSHYPETIGPDMIEAGRALESIGETDTAKEYYQAIIKDFEQFARDIRARPEQWAAAEEIVAMGALRDAYQGMNRLSSVTRFSSELAFLRRLLERGPRMPPDRDDEPSAEDGD